jgi:hypothetical protein
MRVEHVEGAYQLAYLFDRLLKPIGKPGKTHRYRGPFKALASEGLNLVVYLDLFASTKPHRDVVAMR